MEKFKAVEKEMKTKAYSKEGLLASARLDPRAQQKQDMVNFLSDCTGELDRQIEACEAEAESLSATLKRGKKADTAKAERVAEVERAVERHKWHQQKLELIMRLLENGQLEVESVDRVKDDIKYYLESNQDVDFQEDAFEHIYDDLDLDEEAAEDIYGMGLDAERMSSQDTTSIQEEPEKHTASHRESSRRPSTQVKSPMPAASQIHHPTTPAQASSTSPNGSTHKPAPLPPKPAGELRYASVATAAAAKNDVGIAPLPPPPGQAPPAAPAVQTPPEQPRSQQRRNDSTSQGAPLPVESARAASPVKKQRQPSPPAPAPEEAVEFEEPAQNRTPSPKSKGPAPHVNGTNGTSGRNEAQPAEEEEEVESIFHLPPGLQDLMTSFEATKKKLLPTPAAAERALELSYLQAPDSIDAEKPKHYKPTQKYNTPAHYPQEPLPIFEDPALYKKVDSDTLFYVFYYRQGTYQQYLAAKELKRQSWRFHKQYQTWFQRHEEPKTITEEYEQGTYRFFDYESTWFVTLYPIYFWFLSNLTNDTG